MRKRRANSSKSAFTSDQLICRGVGQKVRPLARSCVSSCVSVTLDKLTMEDGSRGVLVLGVGSRLVFFRRLRGRIYFLLFILPCYQVLLSFLFFMHFLFSSFYTSRSLFRPFPVNIKIL